jgi:hypothetical protein
MSSRTGAERSSKPRWLFALAGLLLAVQLAAPSSLALRWRGTAPDTLPSRLSDQEFWLLVESFSETDGTFPSDNLVSNERTFQHVVPALRQMKRGGVYLGVAPDQNFTYIIALEPAIAFILDIRRGNLRQHLLYKALFELSDSRAEFLSRLFSRPRPKDLNPKASAFELFSAFSRALPDEVLYQENLRAIVDQLTKKHAFGLTTLDLQGLEYIYGMFFQFGPDLTYSSSSGRGRGMPTYADLQQQVDLAGENRAYLASEENFRWLKSMEEKNLIVPIVGDVAGPKALRALGKYLTDHRATVTAYYLSNVEQYLFQNGRWEAFYANVSTLPLDDGSTIIRSARGLSLLDPIRLLLKDVSDGKIRTYADVTRRGGRP